MKSRPGLLMACGTLSLLIVGVSIADDGDLFGVSNDNTLFGPVEAKRKQATPTKPQTQQQSTHRRFAPRFDRTRPTSSKVPATTRRRVRTTDSYVGRVTPPTPHKRTAEFRAADRHTGDAEASFWAELDELKRPKFKTAQMAPSKVRQVQATATDMKLTAPGAAAFAAATPDATAAPVAPVVPVKVDRPVAKPAADLPFHETAFDSPVAEFDDVEPPIARLPRATRVTSASTATPSIVVEWLKSRTVNVGQETDCFLVAKNTGHSTARDVTLEACFPNTIQVTSTSPRPETTEACTTWSLGNIEAGQERRIHIRMIPSRRGEAEVSASVRFAGQTSSKFNVTEPLLKVEIHGPEQSLVGEASPHIVTITNPGTGVAENVSIKAAIPPGLKHRRGDRLVMDGLGPLNPGESRDVRLALTAVQGGTHPIRVQATATGGLVADTATKVKIVAPELAISMTGPKIRYIGRKATYAVNIDNKGTAASDNVRARYRIPNGFRFVSADRGGKFDSATDSVQWYVGQVKPGAATKFQVVLEAVQLGDFVHQVGAAGENGAPAATELASRVEGVASLVIDIVDSEDPVEAGGETTYRIRLSNEGSKSASNVVLACEMPSGVNLLGARGTTEHRPQGGGIVFGGIRALPPGKSVVYEVQIRSSQVGSHRFRARVTSDSLQQPLITEELTQFYGE